MSGSFNTAGGAYRIFVDELCRYCENARQHLSQEGALETQVRRDLAAAFHKVKGGAGFFGLEDLRRISGELEDLLMSQTWSEDSCKRARRKFEDFVRLSREVPPASGMAGVK